MRASRAENTRRAYAADAEFHDLGLGCRPAAPSGSTEDRGPLPGRRGRAPPARHPCPPPGGHYGRPPGSRTPARYPCRSHPGNACGIKRTHGTNQNGKAPAVIADLRAMIAAQPDTLAGLRNRALLLLGFAGALRRSELVGLDVEDLDFTSAGLVVTLRRSKTDQDGDGRKLGVPYGSRLETCPVRTSQSWLSAAAITTGPAFREIAKATASSIPTPTGKAAGAVCAWAIRPSLSSSSGLRRQRASIRRGTPVTRCVPVLRPRPPLLGPRSAPSWPRQGIARCRWSGGISAAANCFARTPPRRSDCRCGVTTVVGAPFRHAPDMPFFLSSAALARRRVGFRVPACGGKATRATTGSLFRTISAPCRTSSRWITFSELAVRICRGRVPRFRPCSASRAHEAKANGLLALRLPQRPPSRP